MKFSEMPYRRVEKAVLDQISRLTFGKRTPILLG